MKRPRVKPPKETREDLLAEINIMMLGTGKSHAYLLQFFTNIDLLGIRDTLASEIVESTGDGL